MPKRIGRPKSDNNKDTVFRVRLDDEMVEKLKIASKQLSITKSEVVRNGIESEYQRSIKNKKLRRYQRKQLLINQRGL